MKIAERERMVGSSVNDLAEETTFVVGQKEEGKQLGTNRAGSAAQKKKIGDA
jgi:hypothetical protein